VKAAKSLENSSKETGLDMVLEVEGLAHWPFYTWVLAPPTWATPGAPASSSSARCISARTSLSKVSARRATVRCSARRRPRRPQAVEERRVVLAKDQRRLQRSSLRQPQPDQRLAPEVERAFVGLALDVRGSGVQQLVGVATVERPRDHRQIREEVARQLDDLLGLVAVVDGHDQQFRPRAPAWRSRSSRLASP
jgi:hypothetical protein